MSVFTVALTNSITVKTPTDTQTGVTEAQGTLDINPLTGAKADPSSQRTVYVMGPNRIMRELHDGETFTDCNYWKQFDFITCTTDDGSTWDNATGTSSNLPYAESFTVADTATTYLAANTADILTDTGSVALYTRIRNLGASSSVTIRLNGLTGVEFTLDGTEDMIFEMNDMTISKIEVKVPTSGAVESPIEIFCLVRSPINS
jgi:hypothetical protein